MVLIWAQFLLIISDWCHRAAQMSSIQWKRYEICMSHLFDGNESEVKGCDDNEITCRKENKCSFYYQSLAPILTPKNLHTKRYLCNSRDLNNFKWVHHWSVLVIKNYVNNFGWTTFVKTTRNAENQISTNFINIPLDFYSGFNICFKSFFHSNKGRDAS